MDDQELGLPGYWNSPKRPTETAPLVRKQAEAHTSPMVANDKQVGGSHYRATIQHWDFVASNQLDYFQGQITKYVARWRRKNGIEDLHKAKHFLEKYIEIAEAEASEPGPGYVNQD